MDDIKYYKLVIETIKYLNETIDGEWGLGRTWDEILSDKETEIEGKELYNLTIDKLNKIT